MVEAVVGTHVLEHVRSDARERIVPQGGILHHAVGHVDADPIDSPVEPEADRVEHLRAHLGVAPIQVWLARQIRMQVVLPGRVVPDDRDASNHG